MMEWTIPETVTAGGVIVFALGLIYKFLGQRTDPKLLELFKLQAESNAASDKARDKTYERLAGALDRNTETLDTVKSGIESSFTAFAHSIQQIVTTISTEHSKQFTAIEAIPGAIIPAIDTLTQKLINHEVKVDAMTDTNGNNQEAIQQILAAVLRLETRVETIGNNFETFQAESQKLGEEIKETKKELTSLKGDVKNLKSTKPKQTEKDKSNVQSTEQHNGLADPSGISGGTDQHDSRDASQAVPPRTTGTDTKREDDQSKSAIS